MLVTKVAKDGRSYAQLKFEVPSTSVAKTFNAEVSPSEITTFEITLNSGK